jgi:putative ABC transport system permease protein
MMALRIALTALRRNKLRTGLTMLGIIIGVGAVVAMVALGTGAQASIQQQVQSAGTNLVMVMAGNFSAGGVRGGQGTATGLTTDDARAMRDVPGVQYVAAAVNTRAQIVAGNQNWNTRIEGTDVEMPLIRTWPQKFGAFFTPQDVSASTKVAVLGTVVSDTLFGEGIDPTGQIVRIRNQPFRVAGVLASKGQSAMGQDQDDVVFVPYTTVQKKLLGIQHIMSVQVSARSAGETESTGEAIAALLRVRHKIQPGEPDDFMVRNLQELATVLTGTAQTMTVLLAAIAAVSLLVGGIGIMNIMLVSVTERTREIGLRLAIGAKARDVLRQFIVEALVIGLIGGIAGVGLGYAASATVRVVMQWPTSVTAGSVLLAFGFSAAIGVFFGYYPARRAAGLDPIDALRYE